MMTTQEKTTRFGLMRHAETVWNREKRIQGQLDSRLTAAGRRQAESWGLCQDLPGKVYVVIWPGPATATL